MSQRHHYSVCDSQTLKGKKNPFTHCENIVTVWSQCVLHCGPCFWSLWCSLLVLLLFWGNTSRANHRLSKPAECDFVPLLVGLCDCSPADGRITHYRECLNVRTRIEMPLTCRLKPAASAECACIYFWRAYTESNKNSRGSFVAPKKFLDLIEAAWMTACQKGFTVQQNTVILPTFDIPIYASLPVIFYISVTLPWFQHPPFQTSNVWNIKGN